MSRVTEAEATYSELPSLSGDGYGYGGSAVVTIGGVSLLIGENTQAHELAKEIVRRWNAGRSALAQSEDARKKEE